MGEGQWIHRRDAALKHEMEFEFTRSDGADEWFCPICGRRILLNVPVHGMVVVDIGDQYVSHYGSMGGLRIGMVEIEKAG